MKALILVHADQSTLVGLIVPGDFDVQAWADARRASFRLLGVVRVVERSLNASSQGHSEPPAATEASG